MVMPAMPLPEPFYASIGEFRGRGLEKQSHCASGLILLAEAISRRDTVSILTPEGADKTPGGGWRLPGQSKTQSSKNQ